MDMSEDSEMLSASEEVPGSSLEMDASFTSKGVEAAGSVSSGGELLDTTIDSDKLDMSGHGVGKPVILLTTTKQDKVKFTQVIEWFKRFTVPKQKKSPSRPICSSEVAVETPTVSWPSPIKWEGEVYEIPFPRVDRIDYSNLADEKIIPTFLQNRTCYDIMPVSGKVVVLSVELLVKNAFEALESNGCKSAPLWDYTLNSFVGMLTITDFINVLRHYYSNAPEDIKVIESQSIQTWRGINKITKPCVKVNGMDNLALATKLLIEEGVHRIPIFDEKRECMLFVLTRRTLLADLYNNLFGKFGTTSIAKFPSFLSKSILDLDVGTFSDIAMVTNETRVIEALDLFIKRNVSALPIVDENNKLIDIFAKLDVFALAKARTYDDLDMTIEDAILKGGTVHEGVYCCSLNDSLGSVIQKFVKSKAHQLVVVDEKHLVIGMVSLSDVLKFLVIRPLNEVEDAATAASSATETIEEAPEGACGGTDVEDNVFLESKQKTSDTPEPESGKDEAGENSKQKEDAESETVE